MDCALDWQREINVAFIQTPDQNKADIIFLQKQLDKYYGLCYTKLVPIQVHIDSDVTDERLLRIIITHELGHIIGLNHSTIEEDVMYPQPLFGTGITNNDRYRARRLYLNYKLISLMNRG